MNHSLQQNSFPNNSRTALVLGGGGSAGNAWLIGVIAGLFEAGLDVTKADLIIGTSAGATAAAQITSADPTQLFSSILTAETPQSTRPAGSVARSVAGDIAKQPVTNPQRDGLERINRIIAASEDAADMRRRMGAAALEMASASDPTERWRAVVAARFQGHEWPERSILITAVNARTGDPVVFGRTSGVDLVDAVAASTSGGPAYRIDDEWYIDGGYRSNADNADLAAGYERVLVLSPLGGRSLHPLEWGTHLSTQVDELRASGSRVETIFPNSNSLEAFGYNMMNPSTRPPAAQAGHDQGSSFAEQLNEFWR
jgi:NTE family protein